MAAEALHQKYLFTEDPFHLEDWLAPGRLKFKKGPPIPFENNIAHDVESLFWLAIFTLFFNKGVETLRETEEEVTESRKTCSAYIFPGNVAETQSHRNYLISNPHALLNYVGWLGDSLKRPIDPILRLFPLFYQVYRDIYRSPAESGLPKKEIKAIRLLMKAVIITFEACRQDSGHMRIQSHKSHGLDHGNDDAPHKVASNPSDQQLPGLGPNGQ